MKATDLALIGLGLFVAYRLTVKREATLSALGLSWDDFGRQVTIDGVTGILV